MPRYLFHSAKGSTWEDHKYIKRINGTYYYPDSYKGGRHLPEGSDSSSSGEKETNEEKEKEKTGDEAYEIDELSEEDVVALANEVIRGNFGNGAERKEALGAHYQRIQDRVNEILRGSAGSKTLSSYDNSSVKEAGEKAMRIVEKRLAQIDERDSGTKKSSNGIDLDKVYSVYSKKAKRK